MGNWKDESGNESVRVEGDFTASRELSKAYAADVDSGRISKQTFCFDARGWGLAQWTFWSRKDGLYCLCKSRGVSIGDEKAQVDWFFSELKSGYTSLYNFLRKCNETELYEAASRMCIEFERPAVNNVQSRYNSAVEISKRVTDDSTDPDQPVETYWPPRILRIGMKGPDVLVAQAVLAARGYDVAVDGDFGSATERAVIIFKNSENLSQPNVLGNKAWARLLKR
jgi:hypothetical protein